MERIRQSVESGNLTTPQKRFHQWPWQRKVSRKTASIVAKSLVIPAQGPMQSSIKCMERSIWASHKSMSGSNVSKMSNKMSIVLHILWDPKVAELMKTLQIRVHLFRKTIESSYMSCRKIWTLVTVQFSPFSLKKKGFSNQSHLWTNQNPRGNSEINFFVSESVKDIERRLGKGSRESTK